MSRFAILEHHHEGVHWDFMLETAGRLRTWRLESAPAEGQAIPATPLPDHRMVYLDYEGEISGNRGHVIRWDRGEFYWVEDRRGWVEVELLGERVQGTAYLAVDDSGALSFTLRPSTLGSGHSEC